VSYETFPEIVAAVREELNRADLTDPQIASFIRISEIRAYRSLRIPSMEVKSGLPVLPAPEGEADGVAQVAPPERWLETISLTNDDGTPIEFVSQQYFRQLIRAAGHKYRIFTREAGAFLLWPSAGIEQVQMYYYQMPLAGSISNPQPATYADIGEALFFGAVSEGWRFFREPDKYATYRQMYVDFLDQVQLQYKQSDVSGSTIITKSPYA
jgi:hypothetical protein